MTHKNAPPDTYIPSPRVRELANKYMAFNPHKTATGDITASYEQRVLVRMRNMQRELILDYLPNMNVYDKRRAINTLARIDANITQPYI